MYIIIIITPQTVPRLKTCWDTCALYAHARYSIPRANVPRCVEKIICFMYLLLFYLLDLSVAFLFLSAG